VATARARYDEALTQFAELNDVAGFSTGYHNIAALVHSEGEYDLAEDFYRLADEAYEKLRDSIGRAGIAGVSRPGTGTGPPPCSRSHRLAAEHRGPAPAPRGPRGRGHSPGAEHRQPGRLRVPVGMWDGAGVPPVVPGLVGLAATRVTLLCLLSPAVDAALGWAVLGQALAPGQLVGAHRSRSPVAAVSPVAVLGSPHLATTPLLAAAR
jgi:hypothetical protein